MDDPSTSQSNEQIIFRCVNCITDIRGIRFTCKHNDCEDTHLCGECFCMHAEPGKHKRTHPYELWNEASFKLFAGADEDDQWLCIDEQRLLQAVERYGHGNWSDAAIMVPGKTAKQVEDHYNDFYVDGNIGNVPWKVGGYSSERALVRDVGIPDGSPKQTARNIQLLSNLEVAEMNYMPSRDEFYKEYDNEAEEEISQLVFQDGEDELDRNLYFTQLLLQQVESDPQLKKNSSVLAGALLIARKGPSRNLFSHHSSVRDIWESHVRASRSTDSMQVIPL